MGVSVGVPGVVLVARLVAVLVTVLVAVLVDVLVAVLVGVLVSVLVAVLVGVLVTVLVGDGIGVPRHLLGPEHANFAWPHASAAQVQS